VNPMNYIHETIRSRTALIQGLTLGPKAEAEGGCGVIGLACPEPIAGKHILQALAQMKNRGNGKGGGIAALGLNAARLGISKQVLEEDYLIQVAYLDASAQDEVEREFFTPNFEVHAASWVETIADFREIQGLEVKPPAVRRYFCRVKEDMLERFMKRTGILERQKAEDEFIYQNSYELNKKFYASLGDKKAFVLSHGKDMIVLKIVGYGDQVIRYYKLEDFEAHVWIGHHRYPTKGRVWHPGGAHPFVGLHEALVHNGDFSNYHSISEYLAQRNIYSLFLTDTEVAVYLFDLWRRVYEYPVEYLIEAMAPTTERDFYMLPEEKRRIYREIQAAHIHGSPDGPWFFIVGRSEGGGRQLQLLGITDTSMLRPQVFAIQEGEAKVGLVASERQAIDACLKSMASDDARFAARADVYWNARGGSYTDGGAFIFTIDRTNEKPKLTCSDKFGREVHAPAKASDELVFQEISRYASNRPQGAPPGLDSRAKNVDELCRELVAAAQLGIKECKSSTAALVWMLDSLHLIPHASVGRIRDRIENSLYEVLRTFPLISEKQHQSEWALVNFANKNLMRPPSQNEDTLLLDVSDFPAQGEQSASTLLVAAFRMGWKRVISFDWRGQRFCGAGLGSHSNGFRIDVFGNPGDYLGSGLDGAEIYVHTSAQDQVAQIMKSGKLVIYGDVGQTFMYAAKGGEVYVLGNAAGRPLINAVGHPHVVINGTCLDYLAESFMAGDPLNGGGFVIVNGIKHEENGKMQSLETPYPGGNLFSLASGGAIYIRDPMHKLGPDQLNGGQLSAMQDSDWKIIHPYLQENEKLFGIEVKQLLGGVVFEPVSVYRKVEAIPLSALATMNG
jgi:glutamate synthase domain-containing protein 1/glutamate synthase domain-containing protein 3